MLRQPLTIVGPSRDAPGHARVTQVLAHWPEDQRPQVRWICQRQMLDDPGWTHHTGMAWVIPGDTPNEAVDELLWRLDDLHVPVVLSPEGGATGPGGEREPGVVLAPTQTPPEVLCGLLRAVWAQAGTIAALRAETKLLRLQGTGLSEQMDRIDEELRFAAQLQREFLPAPLEELLGVSCDVFFRPAGYVSGDIYDFFQLDDQHVGFFVADAVGHGVPAALMTMFIKRSLSASEPGVLPNDSRQAPSPNHALARLNHDMIRQQHAVKVHTATAVYGVIDCVRRRLSLARAGHPYPLLFRADGSMVKLDPVGAMLGILPEEPFELAEVELAPGDRLLLYSDGFEVAFTDPAAPDRMANQRYLDVFGDLSRQPARGGMQWLSRRLDEQAGSLHQRDDLTALLLGVAA